MPKFDSRLRSMLLFTAAACASAAAFSAPAQTPGALPAGVRADPLPAGSVVRLRQDQVALIVKALDEAESHGFRRGEFAAADLGQRLASPVPSVRAQAEAQLGPAIVRYAQAQRGQRISGRFLNDWGIRPEPYDAQASFAQAVATDRLQPWLASLAPPYEGYRQMRVALAAYKTIVARDGGWSPVPAGPTLRPGMSDPRVPILRQRLAWEDNEVPQAVGAPNVYDQGLVDALGRFQERNGIKADGVLGPATLAVLNVPAAERVRTIEANLERWRWAPRTSPATRIEVNIASQQVELYQNGRLSERMKAVAGRKSDPTPMLTSQIHSVVLNPPWNVPASIATKELWPKERANPGYLSRENFVVKDGGRLQQLPGPDNSLGRVKFDFNNKYGVYLHDTPAQAAFQREMRNLSHGCVRLEHPIELAKKLLAEGGEIGPDDVDTVLLGDETTRVRVGKPVPVYLFYWTVFVDSKAKLNFRSDVYDWDKTLLGLLDAGRSRT